MILEREERDREIERSTYCCCSTYLFIHLLVLVCALTRDGAHNLGTLGRCSTQLSYPARANITLKQHFCPVLCDLAIKI